MATMPSINKTRSVISTKEASLTAATLHQNCLGKLVTDAIEHFTNSSSWSKFVHAKCGKSHLADDIGKLPHPVAKLLDFLHTKGAPVEVYDPLWTPAKLRDKLHWGLHKSTNDHADFMHEEMADFVVKGFWTVLPFDLVKDLPNLWLSPLGIVPQ